LQPKATHPEALSAAQSLFEAEAAVLHELGHHKQIPRLTAHFQENNEFYLVQEFVQGTVFRQELQQRRVISELEVVDFLLEVLTVLEFVHQHQVIHRDIKPANLIRRQVDGKIVLIDFGAVKQLVTPSWLAASASPTIAVGSSGYAPPEQLSGKACFASDLYAVGMIAIQALTGISPKRLPIDPEQHEVQWRDRVQVNPALAAIVDRMVRYDFRQRYQSASAVLTDLQTLNRQVMQANQSEDASFTWIERGDILFQQDAHQQALAAYAAAIQRNPLSPIAWLKRGMTLDALQQFPTALTCYDRAVQLAADNTTAWSRRGLVLEQLGRMEAALASYRKVIEIDGQQYWAWYDQGRVLEILDQAEIALNAYQRALEIQPHFQLAIASRKRLLTKLRRLEDLLSLGYYDAGLISAVALLEENPDNGYAWLGQGICLARQEHFEAALTALDLAIELLPAEQQAWLERGQVLAALGRESEAIRCYDTVIQQQGTHTQAWLARAQTLEKLQQYEAAMLAYNQVMQLDNSSIEAKQGRARMLSNLQSHQGTIDDTTIGDTTTMCWHDNLTAHAATVTASPRPINPLIAAPDSGLQASLNQRPALNQMLPPQPAGATPALSQRILAKLQQHRHTVTAYNQAIQLHPDTPEVLEWRGNLLVALGHYETAIEIYERALKAMPENANLWCCLAGALMKLKRYRESIECFNRAISLTPQNHTPWYWRGRALIGLKRFASAIESLEQAITLKPDFQPAQHDLQQLRQHLEQQPERPAAQPTSDWLPAC
jgi:tetratricopeptide (TPR) repeat protein